MIRNLRSMLLMAAAMPLLAGCAMGPTRDDPFEPFNRAMYAVHEPIDTHVVRPFIDGYTKYTPAPLRIAISNFFNNIDDLFSAINEQPPETTLAIPTDFVHQIMEGIGLSGRELGLNAMLARIKRFAERATQSAA